MPLKITACEIKNAYSLVISINNKTGEKLEKIPEQYKHAEHYADILIDINGQKKEFSFDQFAKKIGMSFYKKKDKNNG